MEGYMFISETVQDRR